MFQEFQKVSGKSQFVSQPTASKMVIKIIKSATIIMLLIISPVMSSEEMVEARDGTKCLTKMTELLNLLIRLTSKKT